MTAPLIMKFGGMRSLHQTGLQLLLGLSNSGSHPGRWWQWPAHAEELPTICSVWSLR